MKRARTIMVVVALLASIAAPAAEELDEILVDGRKPIRNRQTIIGWLARLPGRFTVDGTVDLRGTDGSPYQQVAQGRVDCTDLQASPAVHCDLQILWPETKASDGAALIGGAANLDPAVLLLGLEPGGYGIRHLLVGNNGNGEQALGYLVTDDMLMARTKCMTVPVPCERVLRITAKPDLKEVEMRIDLEVERKRVARINLVMHRVSPAP